MTGVLRRFRQSVLGASAVEFALVATPFLLLMVGTVEAGRFIWTRIALQETAIAGARCMGLRTASCGTSGTYSSSLTSSYIINTARGWALTLTSANVTLTNGTTCDGQAGFSRVAISYTFQTAVPQLLGAFKNGVPLSATACFPNPAT